ncbi:MAG: hypothetical protein ACOYL1_06310 [Chlamydiia bacterium]
MKTKLTIDNFDLSHSVTYEKMVDLRGDFDTKIPAIQPLSQINHEPLFFSKLDQLFGISSLFRTFSFFKFPKAFGRIRFLFRSRLIARLCPTACIECIQDQMDRDPKDEKEGKELLACFEEIQEKEKLLQEIILKIVSFQKS